MNFKAWKLWLSSGICFLFVGVMNLINKKTLLGVAFIFLGIFYFVISIIYNRNNKSNQIEIPDTVLKSMDIELKDLISQGKEFKAIKKYRMVTGLGLKEAKEYVDLLGEQILNK